MPPPPLLGGALLRCGAKDGRLLTFLVMPPRPAAAPKPQRPTLDVDEKEEKAPPPEDTGAPFAFLTAATLGGMAGMCEPAHVL